MSLQQQLGIGEFGPIYDAEVEMGRNVVTRALVKVRAMSGPTVCAMYGVITILALSSVYMYTCTSNENVCVCVRACVRERERECVCERERERDQSRSAHSNIDAVYSLPLSTRCSSKAQRRTWHGSGRTSSHSCAYIQTVHSYSPSSHIPAVHTTLSSHVRTYKLYIAG